MVFLSHVFLIFTFGFAPPQSGAEEFELWKQARAHWYNKEWTEAAQAYQTLIDKFPDSPRRCKSQNYLGYCYDRMGRKKEALDMFSQLVSQGNCKAETVLDAKGERLKLAYELVAEDPALKSILEAGLRDPNIDIRMQAAIFLSNLDDKSGLDTFFEVVEESPDRDLRDTATKHIIKLGDDADKERLEKILEEQRLSKSGVKPKMIRLIIRKFSSTEETVKVNLPISLYGIVIRSLTDDQLKVIEEQAGIDLKRLSFNLEDLESGHVLFSVVTKDEEIKMFLE
ncbi:Tetratricopeptide repeat protein [Sulfidibacter corallicola]|uniref:Tetratricopeptide repeat protein n=1 Tax=Sulfidibacter corallicola TaxID=2818388 RepID=A0A8A4U6H5_SULCO|nr:tetratricopeptide repeat protein [Sulfidibacter corallicola]QTD54355.1 tetratricopeptide repeat protein [Sulfidibacter corallicola]